MSVRTLLVLACLVIGGASFAQQGFDVRFDQAWRLVAERYWRLDRLDIDWNAIRYEYRPRALAAPSDDAFYDVLAEMYDELGDDHSVFVSPARVAEIRAAYGDLPCLGVFGQADATATSGVSSELLKGSVGYIELPDLASPGVAVAVRSAVRTLGSAGAKAFVLDLRGNPGGRLVEMMQVAGIFTDGFLWRTLTDWTLPLPYPALGATETTAPLAVLIDGRVNSAAEGLAGALQQKGRATVIGERTAGNVEAVLPFCLRDGSQAWIATGVLAPIGAPTWEGRGVEPDIAVSSDAALDRAVTYLRDR